MVHPVPLSPEGANAHPSRPLRFVLLYLEGNAPAEDVAAIKAVPGLTVEQESKDVMVVAGPASLADLRASLPELPSWLVSQEQYLQLCAGAEQPPVAAQAS